MCMFCIISVKLEAAHLVQVAGRARFYSPVMTAIRFVGPHVFLLILFINALCFVAVN